MDKFEEIKNKYEYYMGGVGVYIDINYLMTEIERLKEEKEWLLHNFADVLCQALRIRNDKAIEEKGKIILNDMQQALKEK